MTAEEVSRNYYISMDKIQYYEENGFLEHSILPNGEIEYTEQQIRCAGLIHSLINAGLTMEKIKDFMKLFYKDGSDKYDTVFIGYPVWATEAPQAVLSFLKEYDLSGKTVIPFCTHDGYGVGSSYETVENASHAGKVLDGLAVKAEDVPDAQDTVSDWLNSIGLVSNETKLIALERKP